MPDVEESRRAGARGPSWLRRRLGTSSRSADIGALQDAFLISAVATILIIRLQLFLTHYPQLGDGRLHIAHLLWGGLFMLIAIGILLSFVGRGPRMPAAIVAGVGFGFFIDELGKFVTDDNDYFFEPAAGLIYLVFIALYLLTRAMQRRRAPSRQEHLVNAADALTEVARRGLDAEQKRRAIELLDRADPADPLTGSIRELLERVEPVPERRSRVLARQARSIREAYERLVERPRFALLVGAVFVFWALASVVTLTSLALALGFELGGSGGPIEITDAVGNEVSFLNVASLVSSLVAGALVIVGVWRLRYGQRVEAYMWFERALLVQIFIGQFFSFIESQFSAVFGLAFNILLLITIRMMIRGERNIERKLQRRGDELEEGRDRTPAGKPLHA